MNRALPTRLLAAYDGLLTRHRLATTTVSGALLGGAGDVVVQHAAASSDVDRTAAFFIFGGVLTGPINYRWLDFLAAASRSIAPQGGAASLAAKVALQSTVMQPLIYLPSFYLTNALVRPRPRRSFVPLLLDHLTSVPRCAAGAWPRRLSTSVPSMRTRCADSGSSGRPRSASPLACCRSGCRRSSSPESDSRGTSSSRRTMAQDRSA